MPKFKAGDEVSFNLENPVTIERVIEVNAMWFYICITHDGTVSLQTAAHFDLYAKPYTKYVKGDIWLSANGREVFMVISSPYGRDDPHMEQIGEDHTHSTASHYEETRGPLVKWKPRFG